MPSFFSPWLAKKFAAKKRKAKKPYKGSRRMFNPPSTTPAKASRRRVAKNGSCPIKQRATVGGVRVAIYRKRVAGSRGHKGHTRVYARRIKPNGGC